MNRKWKAEYRSSISEQQGIEVGMERPELQKLSRNIISVTKLRDKAYALSNMGERNI